MLTLTKRQIPEFKPTGNAPLDDALQTLRTIELARAEDQDKIVGEVNARGGAVDEVRKLVDESNKRFDELAANVRKVAERLAQFDVALPMDAADKRRFRLGNVACALYRGADTDDLVKTRGWDEAGAGFERDVLQQARTNQKQVFAELKRSMGTIVSETGGILIPSTPLGDWIEFVRPKLVLARLGAQYRPNLAGHKIPIYGLSNGVTAAWYGEGQEPTESETKFKARYLEPHRLATFARISNKLLEWSPLDVQMTIEEDMAAALAGKLEEGVLFGSGAEDAPLGVVKDPNVLTVELGADANTGGRFSIRHVPDFEMALEEADLDISEDAGFLFHPRIKRLLKKEGVEQFSAQGVDLGQPYVIPGVSDAALENLLGYKFAATSRVPVNVAKGSSGAVLSYVVFALWRQLLIGQWGGMAMRVSKETGNSTHGSAFLKDESWLVMETLADGLLRRPDAAVVCADAKKTA
jgi:HK97 family phage major capsid protein